jgi:hypothetical protein
MYLYYDWLCIFNVSVIRLALYLQYVSYDWLCICNVCHMTGSVSSMCVIRLTLYLQCILSYDWVCIFKVCHTTGSVSAVYLSCDWLCIVNVSVTRLALYLQCICHTTGFASAKNEHHVQRGMQIHKGGTGSYVFWNSQLITLVFMYFMEERQGGTWYGSFSPILQYLFVCRVSFEKCAYGVHWEVRWAIRGPLPEIVCAYFQSCAPDHLNDVG